MVGVHQSRLDPFGLSVVYSTVTFDHLDRTVDLLRIRCHRNGSGGYNIQVSSQVMSRRLTDRINAS